jgi:hypothetical protein
MKKIINYILPFAILSIAILCCSKKTNIKGPDLTKNHDIKVCILERKSEVCIEEARIQKEDILFVKAHRYLQNKKYLYSIVICVKDDQLLFKLSEKYYRYNFALFVDGKIIAKPRIADYDKVNIIEPFITSDESELLSVIGKADFDEYKAAWNEK